MGINTGRRNEMRTQTQKRLDAVLKEFEELSA